MDDFKALAEVTRRELQNTDQKEQHLCSFRKQKQEAPEAKRTAKK
ncbi:hypothetical protein [Deinococcus hopiensis]|nr:hypothetical protein [Deinococcus hopiensis]